MTCLKVVGDYKDEEVHESDLQILNMLNEWMRFRTDRGFSMICFNRENILGSMSRNRKHRLMEGWAVAKPNILQPEQAVTGLLTNIIHLEQLVC